MTDHRPISVLVADDHPVVRRGLIGMLAGEPDITVVGEAGNGSDAVQMAGDLAPDVVLMDLRMPGVDGVSATAEIVRRYPNVTVLIITTYDTDSDILRAVEAGASGYLLKDAPVADLIDAVRATAKGESVLAPSVASKLVSRMRSPVADGLTSREIEVLAQLARGLSNAEIGRHLFIGEATVKTHLVRAFAKLGVDNRTAAVTAAMERGIVPGPHR